MTQKLQTPKIQTLEMVMLLIIQNGLSENKKPRAM